jgi:hypothetical protein
VPAVMIAPMLTSLRPVRWGVRRAKKFSRGRRFRETTSRARILPSYLIIGAQRAGTTSLYDYLCRHPDIAGPTAAKTDIPWAKELHFFDDKYWLGVNWYRSFFPLAATRAIIRRRGGDLLAGEASPSYLFHPAVPERVAATVPRVRLIALLRDPIERAYSHYQLMVRTGREKLSFEDALTAEDERLAAEEERMRADPQYSSANYRHYAYLTRGLYAEQLERWLAFFARDQLLVVRSEDFRARPGEVYAEIISFLGLRPWQPTEFTPRNRASYAPIDPALRARLEERFAEPNARLAQLLDRDFGWGSAAPAAGSTADSVEIASARRSQPA